MTIPLFESMTYTHRVQNAERIEYHYTARKKPEECPHCGCYDLAPAGTRLASYRYDVEDGLPVFLAVKKSQFCCLDCSRRFPVALPIPMASARTTRHFWDMVVNSGLNLSDTARKFAIHHTGVKTLRRMNGTAKPRKQWTRKAQQPKKPGSAPVFVIPPRLPWAAVRPEGARP